MALRLALFAVFALAVACSEPDVDAPRATCPPSDFSFPLTLQGQINWLVFVLNGGQTSADEIADRIDPAFLAEAELDLLATVADLRANVSASWVLSSGTDLLPSSTNGSAAAQALDAGSAGSYLIAVSINLSGVIEGLAIRRQVIDQDSFEGMAQALATLGNVSLLAADASDGTCTPLAEVAADQPQPLGSVFKLYVLGAVMDAVLDGRVAWEDPLAIRDEARSVPSGTFQLLPTGAAPSVRQFAEAMIRDSDNTATDHLMGLVGRQAVEDAQAAFGHSDPSLNVPFLTTRELSVLKVVFNQSQREQYIAAGREGRLRILNTVVADTECVSFESDSGAAFLAGDVRNIREIEWFGSPLDVCNALNALLAKADAHTALAPVRKILSANTAGVDARDWAFVGFKGGSEPGVFMLAWRLEGLDGRDFNYIVAVNNETGVVPAGVAPVARGGIGLLDRKN